MQLQRGEASRVIDQPQPTIDKAPPWRRGCLLFAAGCAIVLMACVLGGALLQWRGGALPELSGHLGAYRVVAYTTHAPTCSPAAPCRQQFADVPLPRYYVIWLVPRDVAREEGKRLLTIPLTLPLGRLQRWG
jgi:hypothetical protein